MPEQISAPQSQNLDDPRLSVAVPATPKASAKKSRRGFPSPKFMPRFFETWSNSKSWPTRRHNHQLPERTKDRPETQKAQDSALQPEMHSFMSTEVASSTLPSDNHGYPKQSLARSSPVQSPVEQPLPRPKVVHSDPQHELPLQRPPEPVKETPFEEINAVFAVDVSGSTKGDILQQEIKAVQKICRGLSNQAAAQAVIIPWDHKLRIFKNAASVHDLNSASGGTIPHVLTSNAASSKVLRDCTAWFLFTDGEVEENEILKFSKGIRKNGLHGTACAIVIFGYKCARPADCNISVGLSVFSSAPDCIFLFHDVDSEQVYVFQSKGCFSSMLSTGKTEIILNKNTNWNDLPKLTYDQFFRMRIPSPCSLGADDIRLQNRQTISLTDIYNDEVDATTVSEIIDNNDNLTSLLLTSQLHGRNDAVKKWINKQRIKQRDMLTAPRPDINSLASMHIKMLLQDFRARSPGHNYDSALQSSLRAAHKSNRIRFDSGTINETRTARLRSDKVQSALNRIQHNEREMHEQTYSPVLLSPDILSGPPQSPDVYESDDDWLSGEPVRRRNPDSERHAIFLENSNPTPTPSESASAIATTDMMWIPGYRYDHRTASSPGFEGTCSLCGQTDTILTLLLKSPPPDFQTPGFPQPQSRSGLEFPLAMGNFPETDIISTFVCCDACAYHLVQLRQSPYEEEIVGAIPLIPEALSGRFQQTTFDKIDEVLSKRFERPAIEQLLLAILYEKSESIEGDFETIEKEAFKWICSMISLQSSIPATLSASLSSRNASPRGFMPLPLALSQSLRELSKPSPSLLQYPLGGFVVMIQSMMDLHLEPWPDARMTAVFQRLIYHITEKYYELLVVNKDEAIATLKNLIWRSRTNGEANEALIEGHAGVRDVVPVLSLPVVTLRDTQILSIEDWDMLQRISLFDCIKDSCSSAIAAYLHILAKEAIYTSTPIEFYNRIQHDMKTSAILERPEEISEGKAKELLGHSLNPGSHVTPETSFE